MSGRRSDTARVVEWRFEAKERSWKIDPNLVQVGKFPNLDVGDLRCFRSFSCQNCDLRVFSVLIMVALMSNNDNFTTRSAQSEDINNQRRVTPRRTLHLHAMLTAYNQWTDIKGLLLVVTEKNIRSEVIGN